MDDTPVTEEPTEDAKPSKHRGLRTTFVVLVLGVILSFVNSQITLPYYILRPGDGTPVKQYLQIPAANSKGQTGKILLATVSVAQANPLDWAIAHIEPGTEIDSKADILGPQTTQSQYDQENAQLFDDSQLVATEVALKRAGIAVKELGDGAQIAAVGDKVPASGKLNVGDIITAVDGQAVTTADSAVAAIQTSKVGDVVHLDVTNSKKVKRSVDITLGQRPNATTPYVGVELQTANAHLDTPFPVTFKQTDIGGPSAGLAFTLTILDEVTTGNLTGGQTIATTGTIASDGTVGEVGGVTQKVHAVEAAGAKLFLVPTAEYQDARKAANKKLTVIPVATVEDAINAIATHGGNVTGLPAAPASYN